MSISAMKCALQSLESVEKVNGWNKDSVVGRHCTQSAHFLRQAIAEAEKQEPIKRSFSADVGRLLSTGKGFHDDGTPIDYKEVQLEIKGVSDGVFECTAVRIPRPPKREWVSLTDEEIKEIIGPWGETPVKGYTRKLFDQIEAKLKEKNT